MWAGCCGFMVVLVIKLVISFCSLRHVYSESRTGALVVLESLLCYGRQLRPETAIELYLWMELNSIMPASVTVQT